MLSAGHRHPNETPHVSRRAPLDALGRVGTVLDTCEAELGERVCSAEEVTSTPNPNKAVLLVQFESGLRIKICVCAPDDGRFESRARLMDVVGSGNFPRVLIRGEGWAAFEWIEGKTISQQGLDRDILHRAARLLMAIHNADVKPVAGTPEMVLNEVRLKLEERLPVLVSNEIISEAQSRSVLDLCNSIPADRLNVSLIHGDYSPSNLVVSGEDLYSVDNEKIGFHVTDYDLCRAATFWDEWDSAGGRLLDAYSKQSCRRFAPESLFFWGGFDLVYRISYRLSALGELNNFCVTRLRRILRAGTFR